jgi:carbon storage regulator
MLVLSRKAHEAVIVGPSSGFERLLKVTVLNIAPGKVRLGFEVAGDVPVHRLEVWERIRAEQVDSAADRAAAPNEEADRWETDGGRRDAPADGHASLGASG